MTNALFPILPGGKHNYNKMESSSTEESGEVGAVAVITDLLSPALIKAQTDHTGTARFTTYIIYILSFGF